MNTLHLKYALEVEKTRSISQAAENLFMAQPNLSKAIRELEDSLGYMIFDRTSKGVIPTRKGSDFMICARKVLEQVERMEQISNTDEKDGKTFSISIPRGSYIADAFVQFASEIDAEQGEQGMNIKVQETNSMQAISNITEGLFRLGIIRYQTVYENYFLDYLEDKGLCSEPIWEFEYVALMSGKHPLADAFEVQQENLTQYIEIVHGDTAVPYLPDEKKRSNASFPAKKRIYVYERCIQFDLLTSIPTTYMWVSPIPGSFLTRYGLVQRRCRINGNRYKDLLIYPKDYTLSSLDKLFMEKLHTSKNQVSSRVNS